jgi:hypothetical protein
MLVPFEFVRAVTGPFRMIASAAPCVNFSI